RRVERSADIVAALADERENPYVEWTAERLMPRLRALDPDLVGISLTFPSQAIPALTLARQIKDWKPECHITLGGGLLAYTAEKLSRRAALWSLVDSLVLLEGERPLLQLCEAVAARGPDADLSKITNLVWLDRAAAGRAPDGDVSAAVRVNPQEQPLDIKTLP